MLRYEEMLEIQILYKQGKSIRAISKELQLSRNTVKKYVSDSLSTVSSYKARKVKESKLANHKEYIEERLKAALPDSIPATVLFKELESRGYKGKISLLRRYIRTIKPTPTDAVLRFETPAGKQMQVDWAKFCHRPNRISAFVATLGHSRMTYVEFVDNERLETLLVCLSNAFDYFGGWSNKYCSIT